MTYGRVEYFAKALNMPSVDSSGGVEIDEFYGSADLKGRERDQRSRSRGLTGRGRRRYEQDKLPVFVFVDHGTDQRYVVPTRSTD